MNEIVEDIVKLKQGIVTAKANIKVFKQSLKEQDKTIDEYNFLIRDKNNRYDKDALKAGIDRLEAHKADIQETIDKEQGIIAEYKIMIDTLQEKDNANKNITIS